MFTFQFKFERNGMILFPHKLKQKLPSSTEFYSASFTQIHTMFCTDRTGALLAGSLILGMDMILLSPVMTW